MIIIQISHKGARLDTIEKLTLEALRKKYPGIEISATRKEPAESRADRFSDAQSLIEDAKSTAEELKGELEEWKGNLPENFSDKHSSLDDAISSLDEFIDACDTATGVEVTFPGMYD